MLKQERILVSRTDRAGDFLLTLPVLREIKRVYPNCYLAVHAKKYTAPLAELCGYADEIICDDDYSDGIFSKQLIKVFKEKKFDRAIIVHPTGRTIFSAFFAGIPIRTGRASNIYQLFLNDGKIQKRSRNEKHEFEYNLDLLTGFIDNLVIEPIKFNLSSDLKDVGKEILEKAGIENCKPIVIHPGHGGSAYNITPEMYSTIVDELYKKNIPVIISLGPNEEHMTKYFRKEEKNKVAFLKGVPNLKLLASVFFNCSGFIGGSTGPLHLAASLELPCVAYFPPVKAMTPKRWGPVGCKSFVIKPKVADCLGKCHKCSIKNCMKTLTDFQEAINFLISMR